MVVDDQADFTGKALGSGVEQVFREVAESCGQAGQEMAQGFPLLQRFFQDDRPGMIEA